jgi:hypothetical protein
MDVIGFDDLARAEAAMPSLLQSLEDWNSLDVNYHPPRVERLWRPFEEDKRISAHCIHPCSVDEALLHPHRTGFAILVLGPCVYRMRIGSNAGLETPPVVCDTIVTVPAGCAFRYVMPHPHGWHAVIPIGGPVYSLALTSKPWERPIPALTAEVGGKLPPLTAQRQMEMLETFRGLFPG